MPVSADFAMNRRATALTRAARFCAAASLTIGLAGIASYGAGFDLLGWIDPAGAAMSPLGALGCIATSAGLGIALSARGGRATRAVRFLAAVLTLLIVAEAIGERFTDQAVGFEAWLASIAATLRVHPHASPPTTLALALLGFALLTLETELPLVGRPAQWCALGTLVLALAVLLGIPYGATGTREADAFQTVSPASAVALLLIATGVLMARPTAGIMRPLVSETTAGAISRRMLPAIVFIPAFIKWVELKCEEHRLFSSEFGDTLDVVVVVVYLAGLMAWLLRRYATLDLEMAKLAEIVDSSDDAIIRLALDGTVTSWNAGAECLYGRAARESVGRRIFELIPPSLAAQEGEMLARIARGERVETFDTMRVGKDGRSISVSVALSPIRDEGGRVVGAAKIARDISHRLTLEALRLRQVELEAENLRVAEANRLKSEFLANMSHELRTPLNAIIGFTGTLLLKLPGPLNADQVKQLTTVQSSARHLLALINDLLDLAKIEAGKIDLTFETLDVVEVAEAVCAALQPLAAEKQLELRFDAPSCLMLRADRRALHQILLNLGGNAIKFTERGRVDLVVAPDGPDGARIEIVDTGIGIAPDDLPRLFQPFGQLDGSTTRRHEGTGLGLRLSQKLAELMGGTIAVASVLGEGSRFTLSLPSSPTA